MKQTAALVAGGWIFLLAMAGLLHLLLGRGLTVYMVAGAVGIALTLAAVFDAVWRKFDKF